MIKGVFFFLRSIIKTSKSCKVIELVLPIPKRLRLSGLDNTEFGLLAWIDSMQFKLNSIGCRSVIVIFTEFIFIKVLKTIVVSQ